MTHTADIRQTAQMKSLKWMIKQFSRCIMEYSKHIAAVLRHISGIRIIVRYAKKWCIYRYIRHYIHFIVRIVTPWKPQICP